MLTTRMRPKFSDVTAAALAARRQAASSVWRRAKAGRATLSFEHVARVSHAPWNDHGMAVGKHLVLWVAACRAGSLAMQMVLPVRPDEVVRCIIDKPPVHYTPSGIRQAAQSKGCQHQAIDNRKIGRKPHGRAICLTLVTERSSGWYWMIPMAGHRHARRMQSSRKIHESLTDQAA